MLIRLVHNSLILPSYFIIILLTTFCYKSFSQTDTIHINYNQILITRDTFFLGISDTIVVLPLDEKFKIKKNKDLNSQAFYDSLAAKTQSNKHLFDLYKTLLVEEERNQFEQKENFEASDDQYVPYKGKIVRNIYFHEVDLFEGSVKDTSQNAESGLGKFLNRTHFSTRDWVIKKNLRFKEGDKVEPHLIAENERIIRGLSYIQDAKIIINEHELFNDSVDIYIITQDKFPIGITGEILDYDNFIIEPYHRNLVGLGDEVSTSLIYKGRATPPIGFGVKYISRNILGSFTDGKIDISEKENVFLHRIRFVRLFISNDMKFGGEIDYFRLSETRYWQIFDEDSIYTESNRYTLSSFDIWLGKSFSLNRTEYYKNLIISGRYNSEIYHNRPLIDADTNFLFHNKFNYLGSIIFRNVRYLKTSKLLSFGITEDVPYGYALNFTTGYQKSQFYNRPYFSVLIGMAKYYKKIGYLIMAINGGTSIRDKQYEDLVVDIDFGYYSPLANLNRFEIRNIFISKYKSVGHLLYYNPINFGNKIRGLNQSDLFGQSFFSLRNEVLFYTPYSLLGFRLSAGPYGDIGWLNEKEFSSGKKEFYASLGVGIHIKNESLTIPTFTMRFSYFPNWPDENYKFTFSMRFADNKLFRALRQPKPEILRP